MRKLRTLAAILAVTLAFSAVGCGKDEKGESKAPIKASEVIKNSYSAVEIGELPDMEYLDNVVKLGDTGKFLVSGSDSSGMVYYITDSELIDYQSVDVSSISEGHESFNAMPMVMADGSLYFVVTYTDYEEGTVLPDYDDPDFDWENFDYEAFEAAALNSYFLYKMDENGEIVSEAEIKDVEKYADSGEDGGRVWLNCVGVLGNDTIIFSISGMTEDSYVAVGTDGKVIGKLELGDDVYLYNGTTNDSQGNMLFTTYVEDDNCEVIAKIDAETMALSDDKIPLKDLDNYYNGIYKGNDEYPILISGSSSLFGLTADNEIEELINWVDSDIAGDSVSGVFPVENGEYIIYVNDWNTNEQGFYRLTERDPSELENAVIINMVVSYTDSATTEMVQKFNQENTDYRIRVEEYGKYYEWDEETEQNTNTPEKQLQKDLATGKDVDIIIMNNALFTQNLGKKGALADMYEFMGKDGAPAKEDFVESALKGMETDGKLYAMPINFSVGTCAVKSKYFSEENWTVDDFIETYDKMPEGCFIYQYSKPTKQNTFAILANSGSDFIDYRNETCSFDSPDFIKILEFADRFDMEAEYDFSDMAEQDGWYAEQDMALRNDKAMLYNLWLDDPREYKSARDGYFGEDITLVGNPSANGTGATMNVNSSIMIMEDSASKDACWKFVSQYLTEDFQNSDNNYSLPVLRSAFDKKLDELKSKPYWTDEDGKKQEYDSTVYLNGKEIIIEPFTQEEVDFIKDYILNAKFTGYYYDDEIQSIINEEVNAYFAGEKSAEEAADIIQNRVSILISEKS